MSYTYYPTLTTIATPATVAEYHYPSVLRFKVGDTQEMGYLLEDEELETIITITGYADIDDLDAEGEAVCLAYDSMLVKLSNQVDYTSGNQTEKQSQRYSQVRNAKEHYLTRWFFSNIATLWTVSTIATV